MKELPKGLLQQQLQLESADSDQRKEFATGVKHVFFTMIQQRKEGLLGEAAAKVKVEERKMMGQ